MITSIPSTPLSVSVIFPTSPTNFLTHQSPSITQPPSTPPKYQSSTQHQRLQATSLVCSAPSNVPKRTIPYHQTPRLHFPNLPSSHSILSPNALCHSPFFLAHTMPSLRNMYSDLQIIPPPPSMIGTIISFQ